MPRDSRASSSSSPNDSRDVWLVLTRWRDEESFNAWVSSPAFAHGHRGTTSQSTVDAVRRRTANVGAADPPPVGVHSELWSYDIVDLPAPR